MTGIHDIWAERIRQEGGEGWTPEHDDQHTHGELARAAMCYADPLNGPGVPYRWPWDRVWWKPTDRRRDLVKAGALIAAEIDRLDRIAAREAP